MRGVCSGWWLPLVCFGALYACSGTGNSGGPGENMATEVSPPYAQWSLSSTPSIRIGTLDGPPEYQFDRVAYAGHLSDGRYIIVDGGSLDVRWFAADGSFQARAGGRGEGPGEFRRVAAAAISAGDSTVLFDPSNGRMSWFGPDAALGRSLQIELLGTVGLFPLSDQRLLITDERPTFNLGGAEYNQTRDSLLLIVEPGRMQPLDTLLVLAGQQAATWVQYDGSKPTATHQFALPFGELTLAAALGGHIAVVPAGERDLRVLSDSGVPVQVVRRTDLKSPAVSGTLRDRYVANETELARAEGRSEVLSRTGAEDLLAMVRESSSVPSFDRMLTDHMADRVWLRDYVYPWDEGLDQRWTIHDSTGQVIAQVTTPSGLNVTQVGPTGVVGVERSELGVESVVAYAFR